MKKILIEKDKYALVDNEDYINLKDYKWRIAGNGYAATFKWIPEKKNVRAFYMHRLVMNTPKGQQTDHINHNKLDNQKHNLRICSSHQNKGNLTISVKNKSGFKGVSWDKTNEKWYSTIFYFDKQINLGRYTIKEEAAKAYDLKAKELFGEFAHLNFPYQLASGFN